MRYGHTLKALAPLPKRDNYFIYNYDIFYDLC